MLKISFGLAPPVLPISLIRTLSELRARSRETVLQSLHGNTNTRANLNKWSMRMSI